MRTLLARACDHANLDVTAVADLPAALAECDETLFDLLVTDYSLPGGTGSQLVATLQERLATHMPPVLLVTAQLESVSLEERNLFYAALEKPFRLADLFDRLEEMRVLAAPRKRSGVMTRDEAIRMSKLGTDE